MADENRWEQMRAIHCPDPQCAGMLLDNPFRHELKCSDCGKYFIEKVEYIEVIKE